MEAPEEHSGMRFSRTGMEADEARAWLRDIVDYVLRPLVEEYWFDDSDRREFGIEILRELSG